MYAFKCLELLALPYSVFSVHMFDLILNHSENKQYTCSREIKVDFSRLQPSSTSPTRFIQQLQSTSEQSGLQSAFEQQSHVQQSKYLLMHFLVHFANL